MTIRYQQPAKSQNKKSKTVKIKLSLSQTYHQ